MKYLIETIRHRLVGTSIKMELKKLVVLTKEDLRISTKSKKLWTFIILMLLPSVILAIAGVLFFIPENQTSLAFWKTINPHWFVLDRMIDDFKEGMKGLYGLVVGYWLNLPIVIATAIYTSEFIAGERAKGSFDLFATKPVLRTSLVASKIIAFAIISLLVSVLVYILLFGVFAMAYFGDISTVLLVLWQSSDIIETYIFVTWLFVMAVCSITVFFSSLTKRSLFATFGTLAYLMGYGMGVSLISLFVPGTLGQLLSEQLSYVNLQTIARILLSYWLTGEITSVFQLIEMDSTVASISFALFIALPMLVAFMIIETRDLL